jgi:hypothetical protein
MHGADPVDAAMAGHELARSVLFSPGATSRHRVPGIHPARDT